MDDEFPGMGPRQIPFRDSYTVDPETGCWVWDKRVPGPWGYGTLRIYGRITKAHRYSYERFKGPIPEGMLVLHSCDNPPCVNPDHLRIGTNQDNANDKAERLRSCHGENHPRHKLKGPDIVRMRELRAAGMNVTDLARMFGCGSAHVTLVCTGRKWKHVGGPILKPQLTGPRSGRDEQRRLHGM